MTEAEKQELREIIAETVREHGPHGHRSLAIPSDLCVDEVVDSVVERLVATEHFYYLPTKLRSES